MRAAILHPSDLRVRIVRIFPVVVRCLVLLALSVKPRQFGALFRLSQFLPDWLYYRIAG